MRKTSTVFLILFSLSQWLISTQAQVNMSIDFSKRGIAVSPYLYGIFFEDINFAGDGGLYAELIRNRSFEESTDYWELISENSSKGSMVIDNQNLLNTAQSNCLKLTADSLISGGAIRIQNSGFWGINVVNKTEYTVSFYAKCSSEFDGAITVSLINSDGTFKYAQQRIAGLTSGWQKFTCTLVASGNNAVGKFALSINSVGSVWLDVVSVFPPTFNNRSNGLRMDLAQKLKDMQPKFMRFPGGCFVEGSNMSTGAYRWKETVGPIEERPGHPNYWGYRTTDGLGYHEFLQLCEDIGAAPLYVCNAGMSHGGDESLSNLNPWIQDALNAIEYANGDTSTTWGHKRKLNGHAMPFNLKFIEIGNEDWYEPYTSHYNMFYDSIKTHYPEIVTIANVPWTSLKHIEVYDDHYYKTPEWFAENSTIYDNKDRSGPKIYVGEYAVAMVTGAGNGKLRNAVGEAAFMTGLERNSDIVIMGSYAPLFGNVNQCQWNPNAIYYNSSTSYGTPPYYVQKMFANNTGNLYTPIIDSSNNSTVKQISGAVGLGTWATQCQYDSITVQSNDSVIIDEKFDTGASNWKVYNGTWAVNNGEYQQTSTNTDCRSTLGNITMPNYTYHLKAKKTGGNEGFLIILGYTGDNDFYWWNIGGWSNTLSAIEHSVNGSKSTIQSTSCNVVLNNWYDIRVDVNGNVVNCYLNHKLIHTFSAGTKYLYSSCTVDSVKDDVFLKIVNFSDSTRTTNIQMTNLPANSSLEGTLQTITYTDPSAENSIATPNKIVPLTINISSIGSEYQYSFAANSVNIFHLYPQSTILHISNSTFFVPENSRNGYLVGTMIATGGSKFKYQILNSTVQGAFSINDSTGVISVKDSSLLNFELNTSISLEVSVKDNLYDTVSSSRSACIINLTNINEKPNLITSKYYAFATDAKGTSIGKIFVRDEDKGQSYTFSIKSQSVDNILNINSATGELSISGNTSLSSIKTKTISFVVNVSDNGNPSLSDEKEFTLEFSNSSFVNPVRTDILNSEMEVYPVPANNYVTVKVCDLNKALVINIINNKGIVVCNQKISSYETCISTTKLCNGIYYLQVVFNGQVLETRKIEIAK